MLLQKKTGTEIGQPKLDYLAKKIKTRAFALIKAEYKFLVGYCVIWAIGLFHNISKKDDGTDGVRYMACFIVGATFSGLSGIIGMSVATDGNVRTTVACTIGTLNDGLRVAFTAGVAMGFSVVGLASFGLSVMFILMKPDRPIREAVQYLHAFGFGAFSFALFARVAGGIYTKAADVGEDLVGKVEAGINERLFTATSATDISQRPTAWPPRGEWYDTPNDGRYKRRHAVADMACHIRKLAESIRKEEDLLWEIGHQAGVEIPAEEQDRHDEVMAAVRSWSEDEHITYADDCSEKVFFAVTYEVFNDGFFQLPQPIPEKIAELVAPRVWWEIMEQTAATAAALLEKTKVRRIELMSKH